jgi:uncharacterized protein (DUF2235 family)
MGRHLICLIDGTWVSAETSVLNQTYSNIYKLGMLLANYTKLNYSDQNSVREENIVFYSRGLGAQRKLLLRYAAGGFAAGLEEEIADVYINLASNYLPDDKIYFFGFSRGAVIARAVAGLIGTIGLLKDRHINSYKKVWEAFRNKEQPDLPKKYFSDAKEIEFVGVFDTVYGGNHSKDKLLRRLGFQNIILSQKVRNAVHILSLDDRRVFFRPILWAAGSGNAEQIWMPGVHSDVGGTLTHEFLGNVSLLAMIDRIRQHTQLGLYVPEVDALHREVLTHLEQSQVVVSNEFESWLWKLSFPSDRIHEGNHLNQSLHPIVEELRQKDVNYRGKELRNYALHPTFKKVTQFAQFKYYPVPAQTAAAPMPASAASVSGA